MNIPLRCNRQSARIGLALRDVKLAPLAADRRAVGCTRASRHGTRVDVRVTINRRRQRRGGTLKPARITSDSDHREISTHIEYKLRMLVHSAQRCQSVPTSDDSRAQLETF